MIVDAVVAPLIEVAVAVAAGMLQLAVTILVASIRPWRYVFSSAYRAELDREIRSRHILYKVLYFGWGTVAILLSIAVVAGIWWFFAAMEPAKPRPPGKASMTVEEVQKAVRDFKEKRKP